MENNYYLRLKQKYNDFSNAYARLLEGVSEKELNDYIRDAVIQRFEFCYELAWKLLKAYLEYNGFFEAKSPREVFKEAFLAGIITNSENWNELISDRNLTSHTYDYSLSTEIFKKIKNKHIITFKELLKNMENKL